MKKELVLITGASSGIGLELARVFAKNGYNLALVSRDKKVLEAVAKEISEKYNVSVGFLAKDLTIKESCEEVFSKFKNATIIVNNAGFGDHGAFKDMNPYRMEDMISLNVAALTYLTRLYLPYLVNNKSGKILNVASIAAFMPGPNMSVYYATKAYVLSFSEAINEELKGTGVSVTTLCPGPTGTGFAKAAHAEKISIFKKNNMMTAEAVAKIGYDGLMKRKPVIVCGLKNKFSVFMIRFAPRSLMTKIIKKIQE